MSLDEIKPTSLVALPLLVEIPNGPWVALLEADLTDYAGMYVGGVRGVANALMSKLSPLPERSDEAVIASTPKATPWRVLLVGSHAGRADRIATWYSTSARRARWPTPRGSSPAKPPGTGGREASRAMSTSSPA